jgi:hypothetical protein
MSSPDWNITWTACFGAISAARISAIESYVAEKCLGLAAGELNDVVEQLAENWNAKEMGSAPGIGMLIKGIRGKRLIAKGIDITEPYEFTTAKRQLRNMPSNTLDRWDLICSMVSIGNGHDAQWAFKLAQYAAKNGGYTLPWWVDYDCHKTAQWQMDKPVGVTGWVDAVRQAGETRREMMIHKGEKA